MALEDPESQEPNSPPSDDVLYGMVSDKRRRYTVHYLKQRGEPVSVRELAEQVAAWENEKQPVDVSYQERKRVYVALYQSHLPTMHEKGIVDYDDAAGMVELAEEMRGVEMYLEVVPRESVPWSLYYAGLTLANALLVLLAYFEVGPLGTVPDPALSAIVLVTYGVSAFVQLYYTRRRRIGDPGPPPEIESST